MTNAVYAFFGSSKEHKDEYKKHMAGAKALCSDNESRLCGRSKEKVLEGQVAQLTVRAQAAKAREVQLQAKNKALRRKQGSLHARLRDAKKSLKVKVKVGGSPLSLFSRKPENTLSSIGSRLAPPIAC